MNRKSLIASNPIHRASYIIYCWWNFLIWISLGQNNYGKIVVQLNKNLESVHNHAKLEIPLFVMNFNSHSSIHNLKCFVNWTVTELRVMAILSRIYYFAIFDDKSWLFFTENPLFGHNFWKKKPRTCNSWDCGCSNYKLLFIREELNEPTQISMEVLCFINKKICNSSYFCMN